VDPVKEILAALGVLHVLNAHGDPLGQDLALDPLVDDHAHSVLGHVEHAARLPVVGLVGHAFLEGATAYTARKRTIKKRIRGQLLQDSPMKADQKDAEKKNNVMFLNL
jgi:hypothetical protein